MALTSDIRRSVTRSGKLLAGTITGQVAALLALPFVIAEATPESMALYAVTIATSPLLAILFTLRLEYDKVRSTSDDDSAPLHAAATLTLAWTIVTALLGVALVVLQPSLSWLALIGAGGAASAAVSILDVRATASEHEYRTAAASALGATSQAIFLVLAVATDQSAPIIAFSFVAGRIIAVFTHLLLAPVSLRALDGSVAYIRSSAQRAAVTASGFACANANLALPIWFAARWGDEFAGSFGVGRQIVIFPVMLVANSMSLIVPTQLRTIKPARHRSFVIKLSLGMAALATAWAAICIATVQVVAVPTDWTSLKDLVPALGLLAIAQGSATPSMSSSLFSSLDRERLIGNTIRLAAGATTFIVCRIIGVSASTALICFAAVAVVAYASQSRYFLSKLAAPKSEAL